MSHQEIILKGRYELITELGSGGMGTVYLAKDRVLDSYWAVKRVKNDSSVDITAFKREVELLSTLSHSDIPRIVDRIEINNDYYVVMDFIDGTSLKKKVLAEGPQEEKEIVEWGKMLCDVLTYLHTVHTIPIIYRDMKPDNVMLTQSGRVKLIDFGIAQECRPGEKQQGIGTKGYAAPEQYKGSSGALDVRTDIYSLGATLYYVATGQIPGKPPKAVTAVRPVNPQISEGLEYIIVKCMQDNPDNRYQSCEEVKKDFINIRKLTGAYRNAMYRKLAEFAVSTALCIVGIIFAVSGYTGVKRAAEENFQYYYKMAVEADRTGDNLAAASNYAKAIAYKEKNADTYIMYFKSLLPQSGDSDYTGKTKSAVDVIRTGYIDNKDSSMYHNAALMYQVMKRCVEVNDPVYAGYANEYITLLQNQDYKANDLAGYSVIASNCAKNLMTQDFAAFGTALKDLETATDTPQLSVDERLENYYTIIIMYSAYPTNLENAFGHIQELGNKAHTLIEENAQSSELKFNNIIPMYEMVATAMYNNAIMQTSQSEKSKWMKNCLEWFEYLNDNGDTLSQSVWIKKANAYKTLADTAQESTYYEQMTGQEYLNQAIAEYQKIIQTFGEEFLPYVYLTQAYLDNENMKGAAERDYSRVQETYAVVMRLKEQNKNLSSVALSQYTSLKKAVDNALAETR